MKIRIYDTDFEGHPVECTGEYFRGDDAFAVVEAMQLNPFNGSLKPEEFMYRILAGIGQKHFILPEEPGAAAVAFLQRLTALGYAEFELEDCEYSSVREEIALEIIKK